MQLSDLVATSRQVTAVGGRLSKIERLGELIRRTEPNEIGLVIAYLTGRLPQGRIGIGPAAVRKAWPDGAASQPTLSLRDLDDRFSKMAAVEGKGSTAARARLLHGLLAVATRDEQDFLGRLLFGELRQGADEGLMIEAIAHAADIPAAAVRRAATTAGDLSTVAAVAVGEGHAGLSRFSVQLFRPLRPMLAHPAESVTEALDRLGEALLEYKVDGARAQIHKEGDDVRVYSRRLHDVTPAVPEIVESVRALPASSLILDSEVIALGRDGAPLPFQVTMRRFGRKLDVDQLRRSLPLTPFFFDLLYLEGDDLIDRPLSTRHELLQELAGQLVIPRQRTSSAHDAGSFLHAAIGAGHEGIMAKAPGASYEAGHRGRTWLKIKPTHTLDLVVLAAEWGHGRRQGWLSNLHLGARAEDGAGFVMLGKTFKGMTDEMLSWQTEHLLGLEMGRDGHTVYVKPELVVEVAFNDVQASPQYPGGLALRFARVKQYRKDKTAAEADTLTAVREIFAESAQR